jgi:hypothetical protein
MSTLDHAIEALAASQHGVFSRRQAFALGVTRDAMRHRVQSGRWHVASPGTYRLPGAPASWRARLMALLLSAGDGAAISHQSAAAIHVVPGFPEDALHVTVPDWKRLWNTSARVHRSSSLPDHHQKIVDGLAVTTVARTLFDLAGSVHRKRVDRAIANCLTGRLVTLPALWRVHDDLAACGRTGTVLMRELLVARGEGYVAPASELEARLLQLLLEAGLPMPEREVDVGDSDGWVGRVEFVYREARLLIEADSRLHHSDVLDFERDRARDNRLMAAGWRILRITWQMITERPDEVVALVRRALAAPAFSA